MLYNYIKIAWRSFRHNAFFSGLNVVGLAVGLCCCMLTALYLYDETHYDRHHTRANDLYAVGTTFVKAEAKDEADREQSAFNTPSPMGDALREAFGEVEMTTRVQGVFTQSKTPIRRMEDGRITTVLNEPKGCFADSTYFEMFQYDFIEGNPAKALSMPNTVVLSDEIARKLFGTQPAYGQTVRISNGWFEEGDADFKVTGVFRQPTAPSIFQGRFFMSIYTGQLGNHIRNNRNLVNNNMFTTYIRLKPGTDAKALEAKLPAFVERTMAENFKNNSYRKKQFLVSVPDVHLSGIGQGSSLSSGNNSYLYILGSIALFTLLIACVNFMNLATARSLRRAGEVGVRKSVGATQSNLMGQFLSESVLIALVSWAGALLLTYVALPAFSQLMERPMSFSITENTGLFGAFFGLALLTGLLSGVYPAFFLSSFRPMEVLKGKFSNRLSAIFLRKGLVVFQFVISAGLILASLVIDRQMKYLHTTDLGFEKDQQIVIPMSGKAAIAAAATLKKELAKDSRISSVGASQFYPGINNSSDMSFHREGQPVEQAIMTRINRVDADFMTTLGFQAVAGRLFSAAFPADTAFRMVANETAVRKYGFSSPAEAVGQKVMVTWQGQEYRFEIVGVTKDFHFESLHEPIEPMAFYLDSDQSATYLIAHARAGVDMTALLGSIEGTWKTLAPGEPFQYSFLDDDFQKNYRADRLMGGLIGGLTGIAILISCLGLFGLAAFAAERRTKEIGVRKVLGASVAGITALLAKDFLKLVLIAIVIASPIAYYLMQKWLADFEYHIELQWWMFVAAGAVAVAIAFLTVGYQSAKAALANPVKSLRSE
jgi:putative ABC transport system permease protein